MHYLQKYWHKHKRLFLFSILFVTGEAICDLIQPWAMSNLIDHGVAKGDMDYVLRTGLMMLGIVGVGALFAMSRNILSSVASQNFGAELRLDLFSKVQSLRLDDIDRFEGGSLVTRLTNDATQLQNFANGLMRIFFKAPVSCIGAVVMIVSLDLKVLPVVFPVISGVIFVIFLTMKMAYPRFSRVQSALDVLNVTLREYLSGIRLVKAFRKFREESKRFGRVNEELTESTISANRVLAVLSPFMALIVHFGIALLLYLSIQWVGAGDLQVGKVMAFVNYMTQLLGSLNMVSNTLHMFVRVKASHERIREVMTIPDRNVESTEQTRSEANVHKQVKTLDSKKIDFSGNPLIFENIGFRYKSSTGEAALENICFSLRPGETLGVIGPTGSGKSTLAALLLRFYEPTQGHILLGQIPSVSFSEKKWRAHTAIVPQSPMLFSGTIRDNILWGKEDATANEIEAAAVAAQADPFVREMDAGYLSMIGQSGVNLSGGQKQRISIARALVRKPDLLVLDDCTSALDVITESKVRKALLSYKMTCVLITQRISTAMTCDRILVLDNGLQTGLGTHDELMTNCKAYKEIYVSQIGKGAV